MLDYKELSVWQESRILVKEVYILSVNFPKEEIFGLTNQIRRAVVSIPSNIAEGHNRYSDKEFLHFLKIAKGSAAEVETQIILAIDLGYLTEEDGNKILSRTDKIMRMLGAFISKVKEKSETE